MSDAELDNAATVRLLRRLQPAGIELVVVGGQALNHWAERYSRRQVEELAQDAPYASKDIDLLGNAEIVRQCASVLGAVPALPDSSHATPSAGMIRYLDEDGHEQQLDFLCTLHGLNVEKDLRDMAIPFEELTPEGPVRFRVMHPLHCLISRVSNVGGLPGYSNEHSVKQLRASIVCMREFLRELLDNDRQRAALRLIEQVVDFAWYSADARIVYTRHGVETFDAVLHDDSRLPEKFRTERYPRVRDALDARRRRTVNAIASRSATRD